MVQGVLWNSLGSREATQLTSSATLVCLPVPLSTTTVMATKPPSPTPSLKGKQYVNFAPSPEPSTSGPFCAFAFLGHTNEERTRDSPSPPTVHVHTHSITTHSHSLPTQETLRSRCISQNEPSANTSADSPYPTLNPRNANNPSGEAHPHRNHSTSVP